MPIVLDAMGSDDHPIPEIAAVIEFAKTTGEKVYFVGNKDVIFKHAAESDFAGLPIEIVHAEDVLEMGDKAVKSTKAKPNNSMAIGLKLVKDGTASAFVTAGNTGAALFNSLKVAITGMCWYALFAIPYEKIFEASIEAKIIFGLLVWSIWNFMTMIVELKDDGEKVNTSKRG